jgi:hypothetical protein
MESTTVVSGRFVEAVRLAHEVHADQVRKGTSIPYLSHVLAVAGLVWEHGGEEDHAIAGLLHDTVEDGGGPSMLDRIEELFGEDVAELVEACSDSMPTEPGVKEPWRYRKLRYISEVMAADEDVLLVSGADKLHNLRSILADYRVEGEALWDRFNSNRVQLLWYYSQLAAEIGKGLEDTPWESVGVALRETLHELFDALDGELPPNLEFAWPVPMDRESLLANWWETSASGGVRELHVRLADGERPSGSPLSDGPVVVWEMSADDDLSIRKVSEHATLADAIEACPELVEVADGDEPFYAGDPAELRPMLRRSSRPRRSATRAAAFFDGAVTLDAFLPR